MRRWRSTVYILLTLLHIVRLDAGRAFTKKSMGKLEKGLLADDIGVTADQFEGLSYTAKCGGKMVLSFLSGGKERRAAKRLLKKHLPHAKIKKFSVDGSKCLQIKVKAEPEEGRKGEGGDDEMEDEGGDQGNQVDAADKKDTDVRGTRRKNEKAARKGDEAKDDARIPGGGGGGAGGAGGACGAGAGPFVADTGGNPAPAPTGQEAKHRLYLKALLKKIRQSNELELKQVEVSRFGV